MLYPLLDLSQPDTWPRELREVLDELRPVFRDWELEVPGREPAVYDAAMRTLCTALLPYSLRGYHYSRLTEAEASSIQADGMDVLSAELVQRRVAALLTEGLLTSTHADRLLASHQAGKAGRTGQLWFCFYPPSELMESGVTPLLRYWGGEALYWAHANDTELAPLLSSIGKPAFVEADVPVAYLSSPLKAASKVVTLDMEHQGIKHYAYPDRLEDFSVQALPAQRVRRVVLHPDAAFIKLTHCDQWREPPQ